MYNKYFQSTKCLILKFLPMIFHEVQTEGFGVARTHTVATTVSSVSCLPVVAPHSELRMTGALINDSSCWVKSDELLLHPLLDDVICQLPQISASDHSGTTSSSSFPS